MGWRQPARGGVQGPRGLWDSPQMLDLHFLHEIFHLQAVMTISLSHLFFLNPTLFSLCLCLSLYSPPPPRSVRLTHSMNQAFARRCPPTRRLARPGYLAARWALAGSVCHPHDRPAACSRRLRAIVFLSQHPRNTVWPGGLGSSCGRTTQAFWTAAGKARALQRLGWLPVLDPLWVSLRIGCVTPRNAASPARALGVVGGGAPR